MSEKIDDGGFAFPQPLVRDVHGNVYAAGERDQSHGGMSLRVWLAGRAVTGFCTSLDHDTAGAVVDNARAKGIPPETAVVDYLADMAFKVADAMLRRSAR